MDYVFTWAAKPKKKKMTVEEFEDLYMMAYPDLRKADWSEFMAAVFERPRPAEVKPIEVWGYLIYAVCDCGYNMSSYKKMMAMRKQRRLEEDVLEEE